MTEATVQIEKDLDLLAKIDRFLLDAKLFTPQEKFPKLYELIREARANLTKEYEKKYKLIRNE
jgi:hypothetical protein